MAIILLIDDSGYSRILTGKLLRLWGHELIEAENGLQGLKILASTPPDCVIADMLMPEMDGHKFLIALRAMKSEVPVIILTADTQEKTRELCLELGALDVLHKPAAPESLFKAVETALNRSE